MAIQLPPEDLDAALHSIQKYMDEEFDQNVGSMKARFLLDYFLKEFGPFAYNQGVADAERYFRERLEDLSATCFEEGFGHSKKRS